MTQTLCWTFFIVCLALGGGWLWQGQIWQGQIWQRWITDRASHAQPMLQRQFLAMGTQITLMVVTPESQAPSSSAQTEAALDQAERRIQEFAQRWAPAGAGTLGQINQALQARQPVTISDTQWHELSGLWQRAVALHTQTAGRFDPRIGQLVRLWGFDEVARTPEHPPAAEQIHALVDALHTAPPFAMPTACGSAPRQDALLCLPASPNIRYDFGAIAKGWLVDQTLYQLAAAGFPNALVDAGGNLAVRGTHGARPWHIAIRHPRGMDEGAGEGAGDSAPPRLLATLDARDEAVNTHGDYERYFEDQGVRYCHILDPTSGKPAQGLASVTIVHPDAAYADAVGLALFVAGPNRWLALAKAFQLDQVLVVDTQGRVFATPKLAARLHLEPGVRLDVVDPSALNND